MICSIILAFLVFLSFFFLYHFTTNIIRSCNFIINFTINFARLCPTLSDAVMWVALPRALSRGRSPPPTPIWSPPSRPTSSPCPTLSQSIYSRGTKRLIMQLLTRFRTIQATSYLLLLTSFKWHVGFYFRSAYLKKLIEEANSTEETKKILQVQ